MAKINEMDLNEVLDLIHVKIHAIRMLENYKSSKFEYDINKIIAELYQDICPECRSKFEALKYQQPQQQQQSFLGRILHG